MTSTRLLSWVVLALAAADGTSAVTAAPVQPGIADIVLSGPEMDEKQKKALEGDGAAALDVAISFSAHGDNKAHDNQFYWLTVAAENGSASAQYDLAFLMKMNPRDENDKRRWRFWRDRAAASNDPEILRLIQTLDGEAPGEVAPRP